MQEFLSYEVHTYHTIWNGSSGNGVNKIEKKNTLQQAL